MKRLFQTIVLAAVLATVGLAGSAGAQTGPSTSNPSSQQTVTLSEEDLHAALRVRHPDLKVRLLIHKETKKVVGRLYSFTVKKEKAENRVVLETSTDGNKVEVSVPVTGRLEKLPEEKMFRAFNARSGPARLKYVRHKDDDRYTLLAELGLSRPATATALHSQIDEMLRNVEAARPVLAELR
jgi:hypothetical protein